MRGVLQSARRERQSGSQVSTIGERSRAYDRRHGGRRSRQAKTTALPLVPLPSDRRLGRTAAAEDGARADRPRLRVGRGHGRRRDPRSLGSGGRHARRRDPGAVEIRRVPSTDEPDPSAGLAAASQSAGSASRSRWSHWWTRRRAIGSRSRRRGGRRPDLRLDAAVRLGRRPAPHCSRALGKTLGRRPRRSLGARRDDGLPLRAAPPTRPRGECGELLGTASAIVMSTPEAVEPTRDGVPRARDAARRRDPERLRPRGLRGEPPTAGRREVPDRPHRLPPHRARASSITGVASAPALLGGSVRGLDILTRSHVHLVEALDRLVAAIPSSSDVLELHLAGVMTEADRAVVTTRCPRRRCTAS